MEKDSALYQLMGVCMNGIMNDITNSDREYQEIVRKSDEYSGRLVIPLYSSASPYQDMAHMCAHTIPHILPLTLDPA